MKKISLLNWKEVEIKNKTVKIHEEYQDKLLDIEDCKTTKEQLKYIRDTNKWLVSKMTSIVESELDELELADYNTLVNECWIVFNIDKQFNKIWEEFQTETSELEKKKLD